MNINTINFKNVNSIVIGNGQVIVNGKRIGSDNDTEINIIIEGDVHGDIEVDCCNEINIKGNVDGDVKSQSSNIKCNDISGNASTISGNIKGSKLGGNASSMSGNVKIK